MGLVLLTIAIFGVVMLAMSVGVIFSGRCLLGSCGGEAIYGNDGEMLNCDTCPVREEKEKSEDTIGTQVSK